MFLLLGGALGESLWLDELHSAWSIQGTFREVFDRAAQGNQTPTFFAILFPIVQTFGLNEWVIRSPSTIGWIATFGLLYAIIKRMQLTGWVGCIVLAWVLFDRIQWFYATEARAYAWVQFFSLLGWWLIWKGGLLTSQASQVSTWRCPVGPWVLVATIAVYLHPTAALPLACQWCFAASLGVLKRKYPETAQWLAAGMIWICLCLPVVSMMRPVWRVRAQWSAFADVGSATAAFWLFPLVPLAVPILLIILVHVSIKPSFLQSAWRSRPKLDHSVTIGSQSILDVWRPNLGEQLFWAFATLGPWVIGWLLAYFDIAPIFHRRYLIASAMPLVLWNAALLCNLPGPNWRLIAALAALLTLVYQQGTVTRAWERRDLVGSLRGENWREASNYLSANLRKEEIVWCSSQLVEGSLDYWLVGPKLEKYLAFPLASIYRPELFNVYPAHLASLPNASKHWMTAMRHSLALNTSTGGVHFGWLVFRGRLDDLEGRIARANQAGERTRSKIVVLAVRSFGKISVAQIELHN